MLARSLSEQSMMDGRGDLVAGAGGIWSCGIHSQEAVGGESWYSASFDSVRDPSLGGRRCCDSGGRASHSSQIFENTFAGVPEACLPGGFRFCQVDIADELSHMFVPGFSVW